MIAVDEQTDTFEFLKWYPLSGCSNLNLTFISVENQRSPNILKPSAYFFSLDLLYMSKMAQSIWWPSPFNVEILQESVACSPGRGAAPDEVVCLPQVRHHLLPDIYGDPLYFLFFSPVPIVTDGF